MSWYRVKISFELEDKHFYPGDCLYLPDSQAADLADYLVETEAKTEFSFSPGRVKRIKKMDFWWKRLFS
ncbi:MAG: hypothetical protein V3S39_03165 [Thermodesulfobacteriota bacterium]